MKTIRPAAGLGAAIRQVFLFELLWKLLILGAVAPLFQEIYQTYVSSMGIRFNGNVLDVFLNLKGGVLFLLLFLCAAVVIYYEYSVIVNIVSLCRQGKDFRLPQVMRSSLWSLGAMRGWSLAIGSLYYVLLLPLVHIGYVCTMSPWVVIPEFVFEEMRKTGLGVAGMLAIYAVEYAVYLLLLFVPICMILGCRRFGKAAADSLFYWREISWKSRLAILGTLVVWERIATEIGRFWRRKPLGNDDFGDYFLKNLIHSEAFRTDLLHWLVMNILQTAAMTGIIWLLVSCVEEKGFHASLQPNWSEDTDALLGILGRRWGILWAGWRARLRTTGWRLAALGTCLLLTMWLALSSWQPPPIHAPLAIGHRGCIEAVENTLGAVLAAQERGLDYVEIDVQLTRDGVPVLFHDRDLRRLGGRGESVGEISWEELRTLPIQDYAHQGADARVASLEEVLVVLQNRSIGLLIELKPAAGDAGGLARAVTELVERYGFGERAMFMSLDYTCLMPILERHPEWWVGYCLFSATGEIDRTMQQYEVDFLAVEEALITSRLVAQAGEQGLPVYVWSVYDDERMRQYLEMGVSGLISDYPDEVRRVVDTYRAGHQGTVYRWEGEGAPLQKDSAGTK